jgi:hypothetical protein
MEEIKKNRLGIRIYSRVSNEYIEDDNDIYTSNNYKERSILSNYFGIRIVKYGKS